MAQNPEHERIDNLERDLYSRDAQPVTINKRPELTPREKRGEYGWKESEGLPEEVEEANEHDKKGNMITKIFMASVVFFLIAAGIAAYIILGGVNVISTKNVDISVRGPVAVAAGEELSLDVIVKNNNNSSIDSGTLYVEYPDGTKTAQDLTRDLTRDQVDVEQIPSSGGTVTKTVKAVLFGEKDSVKQIKITLDYKTRGSNAIFYKEKTYDITIKSAPVLMTVQVPQEVNSGQEIAINIEVASNSNTLIQDLLVRAEYPFGFTYTSATPAPAFDNNVWSLGDFNQNAKKTIVVRGRMTGQNDEERTFRFMTGTASVTDEKNIATAYISTQQSLFIKKPFIGLNVQLGRSENSIVSIGDTVVGNLTWTNNLPIAISDAKIQIKVSGKALDRTHVSGGPTGFYSSNNNTITWDKNSLSALRTINPGDQGTVTFSLPTLKSSNQLLSQGRNLDVIADVVMTGTRVQDGVPQQVQSSGTAKAKISTNLVPNSQALYSIGPFTNRGPMPPKAEQETFYTIVLNLSNSFNDVANASITTELPPYVRWTGNTSPANEQISYNESTRKIVWSVPDLRAGVGYTSAAREVAFQVGFLPSLSQVGTTPDLTKLLYVSGTDRFTGSKVETERPALNIRLNTDPGFDDDDDKVSR